MGATSSSIDPTPLIAEPTSTSAPRPDAASSAPASKINETDSQPVRLAVSAPDSLPLSPLSPVDSDWRYFVASSVAWRPPAYVAPSWLSRQQPFLGLSREEVFLDHTEGLDIESNADGTIRRATILGSIVVRPFLSGLPYLELPYRQEGPALQPLDFQFHPCVHTPPGFSIQQGPIRFIPPLEEFTLMQYRVAHPEGRQLPFTVKANREPHPDGGEKYSFNLEWHSTYLPQKLSGLGRFFLRGSVTVRIRPSHWRQEGIPAFPLELTTSAGSTASFNGVMRCVTWTIDNIEQPGSKANIHWIEKGFTTSKAAGSSSIPLREEQAEEKQTTETPASPDTAVASPTLVSTPEASPATPADASPESSSSSPSSASSSSSPAASSSAPIQWSLMFDFAFVSHHAEWPAHFVHENQGVCGRQRAE